MRKVESPKPHPCRVPPPPGREGVGGGGGEEKHAPAYGKLAAKAKGVGKTPSRMSGHLQPLSRCMVQLAQGRSGLDVIAGCETLESFQALREDLDRLSRALYAAELGGRFLAGRGGGKAPPR